MGTQMYTICKNKSENSVMRIVTTNVACKLIKICDNASKRIRKILHLYKKAKQLLNRLHKHRQ